MTSQELAKLCGVSKTTVSRVINNDPKVKDKTRQKVLEAMKKHNYVPAASARRLAGIESRIIGLFIMEINTTDSKSRVSKSAYFSQLTNLIIDKANNNGFQVLVSIITNEKQLEEAKNLFISRTIFSGIVIGAFDESAELRVLLNLGYPIIVIDHCLMEKDENVKSLIINLDNFEGGYKATEYLIKLGHRKIGHITGDLRKYSATERLRGYKQALIDVGIDDSLDLIYEGDFQEFAGNSIVKKMVRENDVTAIFCANDGIAIGAIKGLKDLGYHVPQDISIMGFDGINVGNYTSPTLSTVYAPLDDIAHRCISSLIYVSENKCFDISGLVIKTKLIGKESTTHRRTLDISFEEGAL